MRTADVFKLNTDLPPAAVALSTVDRRELADTITDLLEALPPGPGPFDAGLRKRFTDASNTAERYPRRS